jgi:hypothetical protein
VVKPGIKVQSYEELVQWSKSFRRVPAVAPAKGEFDGKSFGHNMEELKKAIEEEISLFVIFPPLRTGKSKHMSTLGTTLPFVGVRDPSGR